MQVVACSIFFIFGTLIRGPIINASHLHPRQPIDNDLSPHRITFMKQVDTEN